MMTADWSHTSPTDLLESHLAGNTNTSRAYAQDVRSFADWLRQAGRIGGRSIEAVQYLCELPRGAAIRTLRDFGAFLQHADRRDERRGYALNTARRRIQSLRGLLRRAHQYDVVPWAIFDELAMPSPRPVRDTRGPDWQDVNAMIEHCEKRGDEVGVRNAAILRLMAHAALRCNEVITLDVCHIDLDDSEIELLSKGLWGVADRQRFSLGLDTVRSIGRWVDLRGEDDGPLFTCLGRGCDRSDRITYESIYAMVKSVGAAVGADTKRCHPHALRHSAATRCLQLTNGNIAFAMALTRHRDPRTLMMYNDESMTRAREAMQLLERNIPLYRYDTPTMDNQ